MQKFNRSSLFILGIFFISNFLSCTSGGVTYTPSLNKLENYFRDTSRALEQLDETASAFKHGQVSADSLQAVLTNARLSYKKVEFYLAFYNPEFTAKHLNGAPLLKISKSGNQPTVIPPEGLQVLDELIYAENPSGEKVKIATLSKKVKNEYNLLANALKQVKPTPEDLVLATRLQLVRIFTLGVTGFDTPGSANGLEEASVSLKAMKALMENEPITQKYSRSTTIIQLFNGAIAQLDGVTTFETFDRLSFLRNFIDPLYKEFGALPIKIDAENLKNHTAWNPKSTSIFAANFLDPYFYTQLKADEDSEKLNQLGESLFYDNLISGDHKMSCATCHNPDLAFTDAKAKSFSNIEGETVLRNSPTLLNAVYAKRFFYDSRAFTLEQQVEHVIFNPKEFNTAYSEILQKLNASEKYRNQFEAVFGKEKINRENLAKALASFVLSLQSFNSEFDQYARHEISSINSEVKDGFNIFMGKGACATCHFAPTFSGLVPPLYIETETEILGVLKSPISEVKELHTDEGRWKNGVASESAWIYKKSFKTPTVRNIEKTAPYFHNGNYETLAQVLDFYNQGGGAGMGLEVNNQTLPDSPLDLSPEEINALIVFMNSLTDTSASAKSALF
ncbi:cytochrome c peroxidase [Tamlana sp. 2_MG-2023]|uniref:cytochrome-c peroxidase n=1 Tax=unclassified Tamlana TaxID=2614803 RepID=UPI0026E33EBD|nr:MULTISPECIES: cytochrome c peroxidase [unclassified Tamlana]MDO6760493.1 cytochrome c peroxidase [Tamlana sp. 2_MG-2023]MDO6790749.1 cytochrome c peroxidase [Tamlana sp. 1_MG-2023]